VTVAPQLAVGTTSQGIDDTTFSIFQLLNGPLGTVLVTGNFFLGLQAGVAVVVPLGELLGLQRGANIETGLTNAAVTFTAAGNWTAGGTILCNVMLDNSPRHSSEDGLGDAGPYDSRYPQKSPNGYGPAWRQDRWGVFDLRLEDTGGSPFLDQLAGTSGSFGLRAIAGHRDELAARFVVPAGRSDASAIRRVRSKSRSKRRKQTPSEASSPMALTSACRPRCSTRRSRSRPEAATSRMRSRPTSCCRPVRTGSCFGRRARLTS
jgi:hypothetical protein